MLADKTQGVHRLGSDIGAAAGLAHMGINYGYIYRIVMKDGQAHRAIRWKALPGAPWKSGLLENGDLFVACIGGNVVISPKGDISMWP